MNGTDIGNQFRPTVLRSGSTPKSVCKLELKTFKRIERNLILNKSWVLDMKIKRLKLSLLSVTLTTILFSSKKMRIMKMIFC